MSCAPFLWPSVLRPLTCICSETDCYFRPSGFKEATCFKPIPAGEYGLYLTPEQDMDSPLLSVLISLEAGSQQTLCILNGSWQPEALDVMMLPN